MAVISHIGVWSAAKIHAAIFAIVYGIFGLIWGTVMIISGAFLGSVSTVMLGIAGIIGLPIVTGLLGLGSGAFSAWIYNLMSNLVGGVEIDLHH